MTITTVGFWPVNEKGEVTLQSGVGTGKVANFLNQDGIPVDSNTLKFVVKMPSDTPVQTSQVLRFAIAGDSISEQWSYSVGNGATKVSGNICRFTLDSAAASGAYWKGDRIKVTGAPTVGCNTMDGLITAVDPARLWIEYEALPSRVNLVTDTSASPRPVMYRKYNVASSSYLANACALAGINYDLVVDAALGGGDSKQVNAILMRDWKDVDVAIYANGMNDVYARGWSFETIRDNDIANLAIMRQAPKLIIMGIPPRFNGNGAWTAPKYAIWRKVNEWRKQYAVTIGADYVDSAAAMLNGKTYADPMSTLSNPYSSGLNQTTADGVHPYGLGGPTLGGGLVPILTALPSVAGRQILPTSASAGLADGYVVPNPLMVRTTGGSATGAATYQNLAGVAGAEIADGYILTSPGSTASTIVKAGIVQRSMAIHGDTYGQAQRIIVDNTAGAAAVQVILATTSYSASLVDGDSLTYGGHLLLSSAATPGTGTSTGITTISMQMNDQHAIALNKFCAALAGDAGTGEFPVSSFKPVYSNKLRTLADGAGAFSSSTTLLTATVRAGGTGCIDIGRVLTQRNISL